MIAKRKRKKSYHHGHLRRALIDAALDLIKEKGPMGFTLRETARQVGVSHAAPYRHFVDKDALLAAVAAEGFSDMLVVMNEALASGPPGARAQLQALGVAYVQYAVAHPQHFKVMFSAPMSRDFSDYPETAAAGNATFQLLIDSVVALQREGLVEKGDPMPYALTAWSLVHGLSTLIIEGRVPDGEDNAAALATHITTLCAEGLIKA